MAVKPSTPSDVSNEATGQRCSICGRPAVHAHRPFCSKRCADIDLAHWLGGRYTIAGKTGELDEDIGAAGVGPPDPEPGKGD